MCVSSQHSEGGSLPGSVHTKETKALCVCVLGGEGGGGGGGSMVTISRTSKSHRSTGFEVNLSYSSSTHLCLLHAEAELVHSDTTSVHFCYIP